MSRWNQAEPETPGFSATSDSPASPTSVDSWPASSATLETSPPLEFLPGKTPAAHNAAAGAWGEVHGAGRMGLAGVAA